MKSNEVLREVWAVKDRLWLEADGDIRKFGEQLREFTKKNPPPGPLLRTQEEIDRYMQHGELPAAAVREDAPGYGGDKES